MLPAALLQQMPAQVLLVAALHHDDLGAVLGSFTRVDIDHVPPVERRLADRIRFSFLHVVRIVADDAVAAFAGRRAAHRRRRCR